MTKTISLKVNGVIELPNDLVMEMLSRYFSLLEKLDKKEIQGLVSQLSFIRPKDIRLSKRQAHTLQKIFEGFSNKEIASDMRISERTVKYHVSELFKKFGVSDRSRLQFVAFGMSKNGDVGGSGNETNGDRSTDTVDTENMSRAFQANARAAH